MLLMQLLESPVSGDHVLLIGSSEIGLINSLHKKLNVLRQSGHFVFYDFT